MAVRSNQPHNGGAVRGARHIACLLAASAMIACGPTADPESPAMEPVLREVTEETGIDFEHFAAASQAFHMPEIMGSGAALFDLDGDDDLDIYLIQGSLPPAVDESVLDVELPAASLRRNRLLRNDLTADGTLRFTDVTDEQGGGDEGFGMGVAAGDIDGDGDTDLYVTNVGANVLYRNDAGRLVELADAGGAQDARWSTSAAFCDYDNDGDLDLFVANYVGYSYAEDLSCTDAASQRDYCGPDSYPPLTDRLLRNDGSGHFEDVSERASITTRPGAGLGVVCLDADGDGRRDFYVANDGMPNHLWRNLGDGRFEEQGLESGTAYNAAGAAEAGMGVAAADFDQDGDTDLFVTHLNGETNTLYRNDGASFSDATSAAGLGAVSLPYTGFGTSAVDLDNDGRLDLFTANGAVVRVAGRGGRLRAYMQPNQIFLRDEGGRFAEQTLAGASAISRGTARGDVDRDGDEDLLISNNHGPAQLLMNVAPAAPDTLVLGLRAAQGQAADGSKLRITCASGRVVHRVAQRDGSYLSANSPWVHVAACGAQADVEVTWLDGQHQVWRGVPADGRLQWLSGREGRAMNEEMD